MVLYLQQHGGLKKSSFIAISNLIELIVTFLKFEIIFSTLE